jgi:predicted dithiol-disulfide oxidoreductase (DUF899 family)
MDQINVIARSQEPWNKGKLVGQKATFQAQGDLGDPREVGWKHIRLLSAANNTFKRDYHGEDAAGQQVPIMTVFKRWPDGAIRLHWASELAFEPTNPGQDTRHLGTVEPLWTLFDLTPGGRPNADEQLEYDCCRSNGRVTK